MRSLAFFFLASVGFGYNLFMNPENHQPARYRVPQPVFFPPKTPTSNPPTVPGVALGRYLFYDPILSSDSTISCATCHQQDAAFASNTVPTDVGVAGIPLQRNTPPLFNLAWSTHFFWDGREHTLENQVFHPVSDPLEMGLSWDIAVKRLANSNFYPPLFNDAFGTTDIDSTLIARAIAQFERTLVSHNSKFDRALRGQVILSQAEQRGFALMNDQSKGNCLQCHSLDADALGTSRDFSNNGLDGAKTPKDHKDLGFGKTIDDSLKYGWFKIPSIRNVALTAPYMHDGRFTSLEEVLDFYSSGVETSYNIDPKMMYAHQGGVRLTAQEKSDVIAFLHCLTDTVLVTDPRFSNPFD